MLASLAKHSDIFKLLCSIPLPTSGMNICPDHLLLNTADVLQEITISSLFMWRALLDQTQDLPV